MEKRLSISPDLAARFRKTLGLALLPQDCFLCGAAAGNGLLCTDCGAGLPRLPVPCCPVCALPTPAGETCGACLKQAPHFDATRACFSYHFPVDCLVQALKYQHRLVVAGFLAQAMLEIQTPSKFPPADLLLALPLSEQRLRQRGFNQAREIARPLAARLGLPLLLDGYRRAMDTAPQASLPWKERHRNIRGAFECALDLTGKAVIVVDDVMTSGATLDEFARTLKKHGATSVSNWVAARALKH